MPKIKTSTRGNQRFSPTTAQSTGIRKKEIGCENELLHKLEKIYTENKNREYAEKMKKYMRGQFEYYGINAPLRRSLGKKVCSNCSPDLNQDQLHQILRLLWLKSEREYQMFGLDFAGKHIKLLLGDNIDMCMKSLIVIRKLLMTKSWWDTVDMLAIKVIGGMVLKYRSDLQPVMDKWIDDDNMWIRRTAIIHQLSYKSETNSQVLFRYCLKRCHEKEFFIQKAIGWSLREYAKTDKQNVKTFVNKNKDRLAPLSIREALKHIK